MAFYLRKLRQSLRLVPATKSLGYSTRLNEGDSRTKEGDVAYSKSQRCASNCTLNQKDASEGAIFSPSSTSALVPLSVRDMALVLLPRLEGNNKHQLDSLEILSNAATTAPFTCDDILVDHPNLCNIHNTKNTTIERVVVSMHHAMDSGWVHPKGGGMHSHPVVSPSPCKAVKGRSFSREGVGGSETAFEPFFLSNKPMPAFDGFLFSSSNSDKKGKSSSKDGPSSEQLHSVKERLEESVVQMISSRYDYSLLHKNIVLENNLFGDNAISRGQTSYALGLLRLRLKIHARFSSTTMEVLNTTVHEETGVVRVHWRLKGLPQSQVLKFWRVFQEKDEISKDDWQWFEAFSYFHIGKDGLVHKHRIDRMLPGNEEPDKLSVKLRKLLNPAKPLIN